MSLPLYSVPEEKTPEQQYFETYDQPSIKAMRDQLKLLALESATIEDLEDRYEEIKHKLKTMPLKDPGYFHWFGQCFAIKQIIAMLEIAFK